MITRRDALRLAAAAAGASAAPFAVSPAEAAALLDRPAGFDPGPGRRGGGADDMLDPVEFAESIDGIDWRDWFEHGSSEEYAAYKRALHALLDANPALSEAYHATGRSLIAGVDETAMAMWVTAWMAGVRAGAAYEHLRLALASPRMGCPRCHTQGRLWDGRPYGRPDVAPAPCPDCGGAGTVATPAPAAASFAD